MRWTRRDWGLLAAVITVAGMMRLARPGVVEFKHDEAYLSLLALDALAARVFPLLGMPSSVGIPNAPASVWLMMLPYAVTHNPLIATGFVMLLNTIGVGLLFVLAWRLFNAQTAFVAGLLYAVNPYAVLYSRKIWAQDMHTPFLLLALWFGVLGFIDGRRVLQVLCLPVMLFALQMHYAGWILLPLYGVLLITGRRNIRWGALAVSVLLGGLVLLPFGVGVWQRWQADPALFTNTFNGDSDTITLQPDALVYHAQLATGLGVDMQVTGTALPSGFISSATLFPVLLLGFFVIWGIIGGLSNHTKPTIFVLLWLVLSTAVFSFSWTDVFIHYFITSIPALCLLAGVGVTVASEDLPQDTLGNPQQIAFAFVGIIGVIQVVFWFQMIGYANQNATDFGIPLHYRLAVREALRPHDDVLLASADGYRTLYHEEAAVWAVLLHGEACLRVTDGGAWEIVPPEPFVVLAAPDAPDGFMPEDTAAQTIPVTAGGAYHLHPITPNAGRGLPPIAPVRFANGVQWVGLQLEGGILALEWVMPAPQPGVNLQYFAHFINADGEKIGQRDGEFLPGRWWCARDTLITQIDVNAPSETATVRVGLYALTPGGGFENATVIDADGNPTGTWGDVPLP